MVPDLHAYVNLPLTESKIITYPFNVPLTITSTCVTLKEKQRQSIGNVYRYYYLHQKKRGKIKMKKTAECFFFYFKSGNKSVLFSKIIGYFLFFKKIPVHTVFRNDVWKWNFFLPLGSIYYLSLAILFSPSDSSNYELCKSAVY